MLGSAARFLSLVVLGLAVAVGIIGRVKPEIFLRLPHYGFVPWALTGNPMPPYFDKACLYEEHWTGQKGDVLISSGVKSGTFWLQNIVFLLRSQGRDDFEQLTDIAGRCELCSYPAEPLVSRLEEDKRKRKEAAVEGYHGFQFFTAHHAPGTDPKLFGVYPEKNPDVKYIAIVRNDREVLQSFWRFLNKMTDEYRAMWGGFPPKMERREDIVQFMVDEIPEVYFGHLKSWWERKDMSNVLLLHYRNLRLEPAAVIRQIAEFLEIPLSDDLLATVLHKSSLEYMSDPSRTDKYLLWHSFPGGKPFPHVYPQAHVRPGGGLLATDDDAFLNEALTQKWEAAMQREFGHDPALMKFAKYGYTAE